MLCLVVVTAGCASANKRYEQGQELEAEGRYIEAARKYIDALKKDRDHAEARERLQAVGPMAVGEFLESADLSVASGRQPDAADSYLRLEGFLNEMAAVGERPPLPEGYQARRRALFDEAITVLIEDGQEAEARAEWYAAERAYDRADRYYPSSEQVDILLDGLVRTHLGWCQSDLDEGRYRSAVQHADEAYALSGGNGSEAAEAALTLRATAIELGTIPVAITPLWRTDDAARFLPEGFLAALNDEMELVAWTDPPMFIAVLEPREVRRAMRDNRYRAALLTAPEASRLGRYLGAHTVVTGDVEVFTITERDVREEIRTAEIKAGAPVQYLRRWGKLDYRLRMHYTVVDPVTQRAVTERTVEVVESGEFERAVYDGDWTRLDLTRNERRWFDRDRQREFELAIEEQLLVEAVLEFSTKVYRDLGRRVE
jgi:tetratricopeptide (TPR) repeat protein